MEANFWAVFSVRLFCPEARSLLPSMTQDKIDSIP